MSNKARKCKITVLKRTVNQDLIDEYIDEEHKDMKACEFFEDGQEIIFDPTKPPEDFCIWAWAEINRDIYTVAFGGDVPGINQPGTIITGCTDWFRPVIFKVERLD